MSSPTRRRPRGGTWNDDVCDCVCGRRESARLSRVSANRAVRNQNSSPPRQRTRRGIESPLPVGFCLTAITSCSPRCRGCDGKFNIFAGSLTKAKIRRSRSSVRWAARPSTPSLGTCCTDARACWWAQPFDARALKTDRRPHPARGRTCRDHGSDNLVHRGPVRVRLRHRIRGVLLRTVQQHAGHVV